MNLRVNSKSVTMFGLILIIVLASFLSPLQEILTRNIIILWYLVALVFITVGLVMGGVIKISSFVKSQLFFWGLLLIIFLYRNSYWANGDLQYFMIGFSSICLVILLSTQKGWENIAINTILITSLIHMTATLIFFFVPTLWKVYSYPIFGSYVSGTSGGSTGYTAGLNGHYSTNGTLLAFASLCVITLFLIASKNKKGRLTILFIISVLSVLLTQKRAHVVFLAICFIIVYFLYNWKKDSLKTMLRLLAIVLIGALAIEFIIHYVPALSAVFARFTTIGEDAQSLTRLTMWEYAIELFSSHKLFGIGWGGYRYRVVTLNLYEGSANAHNIYLQLLAETGLVGFFVFASIAIVTYYRSIKMLKKCLEYELSYYDKKAIIFSVLLQTFLLLYGFTGNPIYDFCFIYYAISVAIGNTMWVKVNEKAKDVFSYYPSI